MAQTPSESEVKSLQQESAAADTEKKKAQEAEGKDFVDHGQGVMPEDVWQGLPGKSGEGK